MDTNSYAGIEKYQYGKAAHEFVRLGDDGASGDLAVAYTPLGAFYLTVDGVRYEGSKYAVKFVLADCQGAELDLVYTLLTLFPGRWMRGEVITSFSAWAYKTHVASSLGDDPVCLWHEVSHKITDMVFRAGEWFSNGVVVESRFPFVQKDAQLPEIDEFLYEILHNCAPPVFELTEYDKVRSVDSFRPFVSVADALESVSEVEVLSVTETVSVADMALEFALRLCEESEVAVVEEVSLSVEVCELSMESDDDLFQACMQRVGIVSQEGLVVGCSEFSVVGSMGCEFRSVYSGYRMEKWFDTSGLHLSFDPLAFGFCYLLFFESNDVAKHVASVVGPYLTEDKFEFVDTCPGLVLSDRVVSYRLYGDYMHLSFLPGFPKARARDLWVATSRAFYRLGRKIVWQGFSQDFSVITIPGSWNGLVVSEFDLRKNDRFLRCFFRLCQRYPSVSSGNRVLAEQGLLIVADIDRFLLSNGTYVHQFFLRALRGLLNACLASERMWHYVFGGPFFSWACEVLGVSKE